MKKEKMKNETPGKKRAAAVVKCVLFAVLLPLSTIPFAFIIVDSPSQYTVLWLFLSPVIVALFYVLFRKKLIPALIIVNMVITGILALVITVFMVIAKGNVDGQLMVSVESVISLLFPGYFILMLMYNGREMVLLGSMMTTVTALILSVVLQKKWSAFRKGIVYFLALLFCIGTSVGFFLNRPSVRYAGHGFAYMQGYSSTDFSDYMVYSDPSKLVTLDHPASLTIEGEENMPVMDGAEACYPVYSAVAKAVYKDIDAIEKRYLADNYDDMRRGVNGLIVTFTNTVQGFWRLIEEEDDGIYGTDLFFGARPSKGQLEMAESRGVGVTVTPIGKEAFVFFVEEDNPVENLSSDEIRAIYHGDITNWAEVGGKNQKITAFQRPQNSGSQTMMEYFMGDVSLKAPETYEYVDSMAGVTKKVAEYANEAGAFGYSFRYFVEDLNQEKHVKVIAVDGVKPTIENIRDGSYPLTTGLCLITRENDPNPNVKKMIEFMLSPDGQEIIEKTGYAGLYERESE
ncbi:MAG: substrate-binding domain-containing protein [Lachnospiraceae bacterium]|nr:substrate-binding domain-containing protein [Lachnospiraceae bacterium]